MKQFICLALHLVVPSVSVLTYLIELEVPEKLEDGVAELLDLELPVAVGVDLVEQVDRLALREAATRL